MPRHRIDWFEFSAVPLGIPRIDEAKVTVIKGLLYIRCAHKRHPARARPEIAGFDLFRPSRDGPRPIDPCLPAAVQNLHPLVAKEREHPPQASRDGAARVVVCDDGIAFIHAESPKRRFGVCV